MAGNKAKGRHGHFPSVNVAGKTTLYNRRLEAMDHNIPEEDVHKLLMTGDWGAPNKGMGFNVIMPDGKAAQIRGDHYRYWASKGAKYETEQQREDRWMRGAVEDSPLSGLAAVSSRYGAGLSVNATDLTQSSSQKAALFDKHPWLSIGGELGGIVHSTAAAVVLGQPQVAAVNVGRAAQLARLGLNLVPGVALTRGATALGTGATGGLGLLAGKFATGGRAGAPFMLPGATKAIGGGWEYGLNYAKAPTALIGEKLAEGFLGKAVATSIVGGLEAVAYTIPGELAGHLEGRPGYSADAIAGHLATSALWGGGLGFGLPLGFKGIGLGGKMGITASGKLMEGTYRATTGNPLSRFAGRQFAHVVASFRGLDPADTVAALDLTVDGLARRGVSLQRAVQIVKDKRFQIAKNNALIRIKKARTKSLSRAIQREGYDAAEAVARRERVAEGVEALGERELRAIDEGDVLFVDAERGTAGGLDIAKERVAGLESAEAARKLSNEADDLSMALERSGFDDEATKLGIDQDVHRLNKKLRELDAPLEAEEYALRQELNKVANELDEVLPHTGTSGTPGKEAGRNSLNYDMRQENMANDAENVATSMGLRGSKAALDGDAALDELWELWGGLGKEGIVEAAINKEVALARNPERLRAAANQSFTTLSELHERLVETTAAAAGVTEDVLFGLKKSISDQIEVAVEAVSVASANPTVKNIALMHSSLNRLKRYVNNGVFMPFKHGSPELAAAAHMRGVSGGLQDFLEKPEIWGDTASKIQREVNAAATTVLNGGKVFRASFLEPVEHVAGKAKLIGKAGAFTRYVKNFAQSTNNTPREVLQSRVSSLGKLAASIRGQGFSKLDKAIGGEFDSIAARLQQSSDDLSHFHTRQAQEFHNVHEFERKLLGEASRGIGADASGQAQELGRRLELTGGLFPERRGKAHLLEQAKKERTLALKKLKEHREARTRKTRGEIDDLAEVKIERDLERQVKSLSQNIDDEARKLRRTDALNTHNVALNRAKADVEEVQAIRDRVKAEADALNAQIKSQVKGMTTKKEETLRRLNRKKVNLDEQVARLEARVAKANDAVASNEASKVLLGKTSEELISSTPGLGQLIEGGALSGVILGSNPLLYAGLAASIHALRRPAQFGEMTARLYGIVTKTYARIDLGIDDIMERMLTGHQKRLSGYPSHHPDILGKFAGQVASLPHSMEMPMPVQVKAERGTLRLGRGEGY